VTLPVIREVLSPMRNILSVTAGHVVHVALTNWVLESLFGTQELRVVHLVVC
jgi:hypothetical protein